MSLNRKLCASIIFTVLVFSYLSTTRAERLLLGQSTALSGPSSFLGVEYQHGFKAAFEEAEYKVRNGHDTIELVSLDDGYESVPALANTKELVENQNVRFLIGYVGTPTSVAALPYVKNVSIPFLFPFTGASALRYPFDENIVNFRASYIDEMAASFNFTYRQGLRSYSLFLQDDAFGEAGKEGVVLALAEKGLTIRSEGRYTRNTVAVEAGVSQIFQDNPDPEVIFCVGTAAPIKKFIDLASQKKKNIKYISLSFIGTESLLNLLGSEYDYEIYISQVVPNHLDSKLKIVSEYKEALTAHLGVYEPSFVSLEGYIAGRLTIETMNLVPTTKNITQDAFLETLYNTGLITLGQLRIGPYGGNCDDVNSGCQCNQGMRRVFLTQLVGGKPISVVDEGNNEDYEFLFNTCGYKHSPYTAPSDSSIFFLFFLIILIPVCGLILPLICCCLLCCITLIFECVAVCMIRRIRKQQRTIRLTKDIAQSIVLLDFDEPKIKKLKKKRRPSKLENSLRQIVENIETFLPYIPGYIKVAAREKDITTSGKRKRNTIAPSAYKDDTETQSEMSASSFSRSERSSHSKGPTSAKQRKIKFQDQLRLKLKLGLSSRSVTLVLFDMDTASLISSLSSREIVDIHSSFTDVVSRNNDQYGGILQSMDGFQILLAWNAATPNLNHQTQALQFVMSLTKDVRHALTEGKLDHIHTRATVVNGDCLSGNLGTDRVRQFSILGSTVEHVKIIHQMHRELCGFETESNPLQQQLSTVLVNGAIHELAFMMFDMRLVDRLFFEDSKSLKQSEDIYVVCSGGENDFLSCKGDNNEWMYNLSGHLEAGEEKELLNLACRLLLDDHLEEGKEKLEEYLNMIPDDGYSRLLLNRVLQCSHRFGTRVIETHGEKSQLRGQCE